MQQTPPCNLQPGDPASDAAEGLYRLVDAAFEKRAIAISSELHPSGFDDLMPKPLATATADRLVHHAPTAAPATQEALATAYADAAGLPAPRVSGTPGWLVRVLGVANGGMRELAEMAYQFDRPFVMDSSRSEAELGLAPTPMHDGVASTVAWWPGRRAAPAA